MSENEYDENGNAIHQENSDTKLKTNHTMLTNVFDENNRVTETEVYDVLHNYLQSKEIVKYNEDDRIIEHEIYHHNAMHDMQKTHYRLRYEWEMGEWRAGR